MVGFHWHAIGSLADWHGSDSRKNFGQHAVVRGIQVLNEYDGQACVGGQIGKQKLKNFQSPAEAPMPTTGTTASSVRPCSRAFPMKPPRPSDSVSSHTPPGARFSSIKRFRIDSRAMAKTGYPMIVPQYR